MGEFIKMSTPIDLGTAIMEAVKEIGGLLKLWIAGAEIRKMKAAVDTGEKYIREAASLLEGLTSQNVLNKEGKQTVEILKKLEEKFFKFN